MENDKKHLNMLEELLAYRAIGTVAGYERAIQISIENYSLYKEYKAKVKQYEAIGTVEDIEKSMQNVSVLLAEHELLKLYQSIGTIEELKALKEKNEPKKGENNGI